jgi:hypothetical protein
MERRRDMLRKSGSDATAKLKDLLAFEPQNLGQSCPQHCPHLENVQADGLLDPLGEPLSICEVAGIIGCSVWTVRQRYLPLSLPHLRSGPNGKLIFYKNQVIHWLLTQQQKGGTTT